MAADTSAAVELLSAISDADRMAVLAWIVLRSRADEDWALQDCQNDLGMQQKVVRTAVARLVSAGYLERREGRLTVTYKAIRMGIRELDRQRQDVLDLFEPYPRLAGLLSHGRLVQLPDSWDLQLELADALASMFVQSRRYSESEVNQILRRIDEDFASLRRLLIDTGRLRRANGIYERATESATS